MGCHHPGPACSPQLLLLLTPWPRHSNRDYMLRGGESTLARNRKQHFSNLGQNKIALRLRASTHCSVICSIYTTSRRPDWRITACYNIPAKSLTLTSAPRLMSSLTCFTSPRIAAMWRGVSPRSFLLLTLSFWRVEVLLGTFFCTGVVCEG